jgi:hypothetical protein
MKRLLRSCGLFVLLAFFWVPVMADALEAPVTLSHELTSTFQGASALSLNYTVHVENSGEKALTNLNFALLPLPPFITRSLVLKLAFLGAGESADLDVELLAPQEPDFEAMTFAQLSFAVKGTDIEGLPVEFHVTSFPTLMGGSGGK